MNTTISRREFLTVTGLTGAAFVLVSCGSSQGKKERLTIIDRLQGNPLTQPPQIPDAWSYAEGEVRLVMSKLPELADLGGAVRIEGEVLPAPMLVFQGEDAEYYAFENVCAHGGRMVDPLAGTLTIQCCSASKSTYDYDGNVLSGPAEGPLTKYMVEKVNGELVIRF